VGEPGETWLFGFPDAHVRLLTGLQEAEVLTPSTEAEDRAVKLPLYARAKVAHVWVISPEARTLEVYRLEAAGWLLLGTWAGDVRVRAEPFEAVELDLSLLWLPPEPEADED
jgi:Uma2 family endonuclease